MTNEEAVEWIELLIKEMKRDTSGPGADPKYKDEVYEALELAIKALEERPKGKWEFVQYDANLNIGNWHCSKCRYIQFTMDRPKYCPNCGAKMVR